MVKCELRPLPQCPPSDPKQLLHPLGHRPVKPAWGWLLEGHTPVTRLEWAYPKAASLGGLSMMDFFFFNSPNINLIFSKLFSRNVEEPPQDM